MRLILRDGSHESSSSSVNVRSSIGSVEENSFVNERMCCVLVRERVAAIESGVEGAGVGRAGSKWARTRAENKSPTPEK